MMMGAFVNVEILELSRDWDIIIWEGLSSLAAFMRAAINAFVLFSQVP